MRSEVKVGLLVASLSVVIEMVVFNRPPTNIPSVIISFVSGGIAAFIVKRWLK